MTTGARPAGRWRRAAPLAGLAGLAVAAGAGLLWAGGAASLSGPPPEPPSVPAAAPAPAAPAPAPAPAAPAPAGPAAPVEPTAVRIPSIGVASPLVDLGLTADGELEVPADFALAGWFELGTVPGDPGPAVVAGHVDSRSGPAVFYRLRELAPGDLVEVERSDGAVARFRVDRVEQYPKARFPTAAVYGPAPGAQLRLITCGGVFDRSVAHYRDNVVVYATAA